MTDMPMIFNGNMVRALLAGNKTQDRRLAKFVQKASNHTFHVSNRHGGIAGCCAKSVMQDGPNFAPFKIGDKLWVKETFTEGFDYDEDDKPIGEQPRIFYAASECPRWYDTNLDVWLEKPKWTPSIYMPKRASRMTLPIIDVRVEPLLDISHNDALAEGIVPVDYGYGLPTGEFAADSPRESYLLLWDRINGAGTHKLNPWVTALTFDVRMQNIGGVV